MIGAKELVELEGLVAKAMAEPLKVPEEVHPANAAAYLKLRAEKFAHCELRMERLDEGWLTLVSSFLAMQSAMSPPMGSLHHVTAIHTMVVDAAAALLRSQARQIEELGRVLKAIQWSGISSGSGYSTCPSCGSRSVDSHNDSCDLARAINSKVGK